MQSPITSIMRKATKKEGEPYNIITFPTHERYQSGLTKTNANFYMWWSQGIKTWNDNYGPLPENHVLLDPSKGENQIPLDVQFDGVLSQNKFGQFQVAENISKRLHLPLISLEHTLPMQRWTSLHMEELRKLEGHINLFISEYSRNAWGWKPEEADVIHHGVDTELFEDRKLERKSVVLSVVNDWINRDWCCNFQGWKRITQGLPVRAVGDTPGFSLPASSIENLVEEYNTARIFINTAHVSPIPTSLLEAMSCGCACVSVATCMIPEIITSGVNGFISNDENELKYFLQRLLKDENLATKLGEEARKTIKEKFGLGKFVENWNNIFKKLDDIIFIG